MLVLERPIRREDWVQEVGERNDVSQSAEKSVENAGPWEPAVQKLAEFQHLGDDWDGLGARAPSPELLASAVGLSYVLYEKGVNPPDAVVPGVDGSIVFEWQFPDGTYGEVEVVQPLHAEVMMIEPGKPAKHWTLPTE